MPISKTSREAYHPHVDEEARFRGGERDYPGRFSIIASQVDLEGKSVLDLGCSGGFFAFSAARTAREVVAIDADGPLIEKNREAAKRLGIDNITFLHQEITPALFEDLPRFDLVFFLSVFHHMVIDSGTYAWAGVGDTPSAMQVLERIRGIATTLVFEMGQPDEGYDWCPKIAQLSPDLDTWVREHVFGESFEVRRVEGSAYGRFPYRLRPSLWKRTPKGALGGRLLKLTRFDRRDFRPIYVGQRIGEE